MKKEDGDNATSLAKFLNVSKGKASELYNSMSDDIVTPTNDIKGVAAINKTISNIISGRGTLFGMETPGSSLYNCWQSCLDISKGISPKQNTFTSNPGFKKEILQNYEDVSDTPSQYKFGHTVLRFGKAKWHFFHGSYNKTTHGATYLGTSRNGTIYTWSKNGSSAGHPGIFTVPQLSEIYDSKIEGYRAKPGGGFYNLK